MSRVLRVVLAAVAAGCAPAAPRSEPVTPAQPRILERRAPASCDSGSDAIEADTLERRLLAATPFVRRSGCRLSFLSRSGVEELALDDVTREGDAWVIHRYRGPVARLGAHLVERRFYEGGGHQLVFPGGALIPVAGPPLLSPDGQRFAAWSMDLVAEYDPNVLQVWRRTPAAARLELAISSEDWGPSDVHWLDNATVAFVQNFPTDDPNIYRTRPVRLTRGADRWTLEPATRDSIRSELLSVDVASGRIDSIFAMHRHFEAPNWAPDGSYLIVNSGGRLYRVAARGAVGLEEIPTGFATRNNNDHGISPDGRWLVISHHAAEHITEPGQDWLASSIYVLPIAGSANPRKVTSKAPSFWHGWSPDGKTLAYVGRRDGEFDIYTIPVDGGEETRITTCRGLDDGPDYSPDGRYIYYNSYCSGSMQIWRMRPDGSQPEQLTRDAYSNWFPHPSPDGRWVVYLAYLEDQREAHPFGRQVKLRLMDTRDGSVRDLTTPFFGGQGTLNVPSWSPDSRRVAFVRYAIRSRQ